MGLGVRNINSKRDTGTECGEMLENNVYLVHNRHTTVGAVAAGPPVACIWSDCIVFPPDRPHCSP